MSFKDIKASDIKELDDFDELIRATQSSNPTVRKKALREFCPCHVKKDIDVIWDRILEMYTDSDENVREQVVHSLCDGSPKHLEQAVVDTLEKLWNDPSDKVKKKVRRALNEYRRNGNWNIL